MYKYIQQNKSNTEIIVDLNDITDYIYEISFNIIKQQFKGNDNIEINLNPFLRTIYILKIAHEYIHKKLKIYDCIHLNIQLQQNKNQYLKNTYNKIRNEKMNKFLNNCKNCLKCLYVYNGEMLFNDCEYSPNDKLNKIEISSDSYSYLDIIKFANKYLTENEINNLKKYCIFSNNMYDEHIDFPKFIKIIYLFTYNLMCYQSYIHDNEIRNIKNYIKKMIITAIQINNNTNVMRNNNNCNNNNNIDNNNTNVMRNHNNNNCNNNNNDNNYNNHNNHNNNNITNNNNYNNHNNHNNNNITNNITNNYNDNYNHNNNDNNNNDNITNNNDNITNNNNNNNNNNNDNNNYDNNINNNITNNNYIYYLDFKYFDFFKKYLYIGNNATLIKFYNSNKHTKNNNLDNELTFSYKININNDILSYLNEKEIKIYKSINIVHLLNFIKNEYVEILDFNPYAIKFKNIISTPDAFNFKYLYDEYKILYSTI